MIKILKRKIKQISNLVGRIHLRNQSHRQINNKYLGTLIYDQSLDYYHLSSSNQDRFNLMILNWTQNLWRI
jgi:hypothetical protein